MAQLRNATTTVYAAAVPHLCEAELAEQQLSKDRQQEGVLAQREGHLLLKGGLLKHASNSTGSNADTHSCSNTEQEKQHRKQSISDLLPPGGLGTVIASK